MFAQKPVFTTIPKLELRIVLAYLGNISSITKKRLNRCIGKRLKFFKLKIDFQTVNRLKSYFRFNYPVTCNPVIDCNLFLKPYNLTSCINLSAEAAQLPITVKLTDM